MSDWRPIETAPRDGTRIVLWMGGVWRHSTMGQWAEAPCPSDWPMQWRTDCGNYTPDVATHWMPLPEPPR